MKKLIESMDRIEECGMAEGPMGMNPPPAPEMDKGNPVTVNVSMNASGKEHVADLLDMMKNAGLGDAAPAADAMMSPRMDMERLSGIMSEPADGLDDKAMSLPAPDDIEGSEDESYANEMYDEADLDEGAMSNVHAEIEAADDRAQAVMDIIDKNGPEGKYLYGELEQLAIEAGTTFNNAESEPEDFLGDLLDNMGISAYNNEYGNEDIEEGAMSNIHAEIEAAGDRAQAVMDMIDKDGPEGKYLYGELEKLAAKEGTTLSVDDEGSMPEDFIGDLLDDMGISAYNNEDIEEGAMSNIHAEIEAADDRAQATMELIDKNGPEGKYLYNELEKLAAKQGTTLSVDDEGSMPEDFIGDLLDDMGISAYKDEAATEDMSGEGTYTIKVKGKNMDSQNELARIAQLSGVAAPQEMETEASGDYENEPDEQYSDLSAVIPDGDDLHKKKKTHPATAGGDNPMAIENIKAALYAALTEKKMSEGEVPAGLKAYQAKKGKGKAPAKGKSKSGKMPMDAGKDGKKGTKDDKPAFLKKEEMAAEGRGKKTKVMAGRGRGK